MIPTVVVDTNVLVSGMLKPDSKPAKIIQAIAANLILPFVSNEILAEYADVLARPKFPFSQHSIDGVLAMFAAQASQVAPQGLSPTLPDLAGITFPDPDDIKFVQCALAARANYIITGNVVHFPALTFTTIITPADFLSSVLEI